MRRQQKKSSDDKSPDGKNPSRAEKEQAPTSGSQLLRKTPSTANRLPTISLAFGPNILEIKSQIIMICQQRGIRKMAKSLISGSFDTREVLQIDNDLLGAVVDSHNFQMDAYMKDWKAINEDCRIYLKSKEQLVGILKSMTDKSLDEKLITSFQQQ